MLPKILTNFCNSRTVANRTCSTRSSSLTNWVYWTRGCLNRIMRFLKARSPQGLRSKRSWSTTKKSGSPAQISICLRSWRTLRKSLRHQGGILLYHSLTHLPNKLESSLPFGRTLMSTSCHQRREVILLRSKLQSTKNTRGAKNSTHQFWATSTSQILQILSKWRGISQVWLYKVIEVTITPESAKELFLLGIKWVEIRSIVLIITAGIFSWVAVSLPVNKKGYQCPCPACSYNPSRKPMLSICESPRVLITTQTRKINNITILSGNTTNTKMNNSNRSKWLLLWKAFNRKDILYNHNASTRWTLKIYLWRSRCWIIIHPKNDRCT